jgi:hypothetical protein
MKDVIFRGFCGNTGARRAKNKDQNISPMNISKNNRKSNANSYRDHHKK